MKTSIYSDYDLYMYAFLGIAGEYMGGADVAAQESRDILQQVTYYGVMAIGRMEAPGDIEEATRGVNFIDSICRQIEELTVNEFIEIFPGEDKRTSSSDKVIGKGKSMAFARKHSNEDVQRFSASVIAYTKALEDFTEQAEIIAEFAIDMDGLEIEELQRIE